MNRRATFWLGAASAADYLAQMLLPALLVRTLAPEEFGGYRILWMTAQTAALVLSLNMALNLIYLAPRHPLARRGALLGNALVYLVLVGGLAGLLSTPLLRLVAGSHAQQLFPAWAVPAFVCAWMASLPFDHIGLIAGQPRSQARLAMVQTLLRVALLGGAAWFTRSLNGIVIGMITLAAARLCLVLWFARSSRAFGRLHIDAGLASTQVRYGIGFGIGASLFALRGQADAWVAAALFDPVGVATISIALAIVPIIGVIRQTFTSATVSEVARLVAAGEAQAALQVNRRANLATALVVFPLVGAFVAVAPDAISLVYTPAYLSAAWPARFYAMAYAVCVLEMSTVVQALGDGLFVMRSGAALLIGGSAAAYLGASHAGLPGIALGSLAAMWLGSAWNIAHVAARCNTAWASIQAWREMAWLGGLAATAAAVTGFGLSHFAAGSAWARVVCGSACFAALYIGMAALWKPTRTLYTSPWQRRRAHAPPLAGSHP